MGRKANILMLRFFIPSYASLVLSLRFALMMVNTQQNKAN